MADIKVVHYSGKKGTKPWDFVLDGHESEAAGSGKESGLHDFLFQHVLPKFDNYNLWIKRDAATWAWHEDQI